MPGHVLAEVIAGAFHHGDRAGVADAEPPTPPPRDEQAPAGGAVADRVAREHRIARGIAGKRPDGDDPAAHALADIVLGLALEGELDSIIKERATALASAA